jgi:hypothetical protein
MLEMALVGYESEKKRIEGRIAELRARLARRRPAQDGGGRTQRRARPKRVLSAEARERIAAAQRKRWAAQRKQK